jgi:hypothetical protein
VLLVLALLAFVPAGTGGAQGRARPDGAGEGSGPADDGPPRSTRFFLAGLGLVATLFALGAHTPVWRLFYELVPGISLFRAPSMAIFLAAFAVTTLAGLGVDRAARLLATPEGRRQVTRITLGAAGLLALGTLLAASGLLLDAWQAVVVPELPPARLTALGNLEPHLVRGFFLVTLLVGLVAGVFFAAGKGLAGGPLLVAALTGLVVVDLARIDAPFIQVTDPSRVTVADANVRFLQSRTRRRSLRSGSSPCSRTGRTCSPPPSGSTWRQATTRTTWRATGSSSAWWGAAFPSSSPPSTRWSSPF